MTFLWGSNTDFGQDVAIGPNGDIYVAAGAASDNFPLVDPIQAVRSDQADTESLEVLPLTHRYRMTYHGHAVTKQSNGPIIGFSLSEFP